MEKKIVEGGKLKKNNARSCFLLNDRHRRVSGGGGRHADWLLLLHLVSRKEERTRNLNKKAIEATHCRGPILGSGG